MRPRSPATRLITAGAGNDVIKVGPIFGAASQFTGTSTAELDLEDTTSLPVTVNQTTGLRIGSFVEPLSQLAGVREAGRRGRGGHQLLHDRRLDPQRGV